MRRIVFLFSYILIVIVSCGQKNAAKELIPLDSVIVLSIGENQIKIIISKYGNDNLPVMLNLHADETTSVDAAKVVLSNTGGTLIAIQNDKKRIIEFGLKGKKFRFDPNRMFTKDGIRATLLRHSGIYDEEASNEIMEFGKRVLRLLPSHSTLIALHNNGPGGLNIRSYAKGGEYARDAEEVAIKSGVDPDDFLLVTEKKVFKKLRDRGFNVVFQENSKAADDGSLSIYYGRRKKSYVNSEAEVGHLSVQVEMLKAVVEAIK